MKKIFKTTTVVTIAIMIFMLLFSGCGKPLNADNESAKSESESNGNNVQNVEVQNGTSDNYPLTVKDGNGFEMTFDKKPEKIVSLTLGTDEILLELVEKERIVALSEIAIDEGLSNIADKAKDFTLVGNKDVEKIISLQPDLIFVADWTDANIVEQLRGAKIKVYAYKTPNGIDEQKKSIEEISRVIGEEEKGAEILANMDSKLKYVEEKVKNLKEDEKLTAISCDSFFYAYGKNTTFDDISSRAGVINLASKMGMEGWVQISKEKIIELNPDVLILPGWSYEGFDSEAFFNDIKNDKSLQNVSAVKNNRVFALKESHTTAISQYIVFGVEDLAKAVYPTLFEE